MKKHMLVLLLIILLVIGIVIGYYLLPYLSDLIVAEESVFGATGGASPPSMPS